jgi:hypothetical protein
MHDPIAEIRALVEKVRFHIGTDDPAPETEDASEIAAYWIQRYFKSRGYTYYSKTRAARPEMAKLAGLGWLRRWRVPSMVDPTRRPPMPKADPLAHDPVAKVVRSLYVVETLVRTPKELIEEAKREAERGESDLQDPPANQRELQDHLVRIAPALQARRMFKDREKVDFFLDLLDGWLPRDPRKYSSYGYVRTEYWENVRSGEGLWVFTAFKSGWRADERHILWEVWQKVKVFEKVAESLDEPLEHEPGDDEDRELREAVMTLYQLKEALDSEAAWAEFAEEADQD